MRKKSSTLILIDEDSKSRAASQAYISRTPETPSSESSSESASELDFSEAPRSKTKLKRDEEGIKASRNDLNSLKQMSTEKYTKAFGSYISKATTTGRQNPSPRSSRVTLSSFKSSIVHSSASSHDLAFYFYLKWSSMLCLMLFIFPFLCSHSLYSFSFKSRKCSFVF